MNERTNLTMKRAKCQPNKRNMDQCHEQTPSNPVTQEMTEIFKRKKNDASLVQNKEKYFRAALYKISRN